MQSSLFADSLHQLKRDRRKAERRWIKRGLIVDLKSSRMPVMSTMLLSSMQNVAITTVRFLTVATITKPCFPSLVIRYITRNQQSFLITTVQQP